MTADDRPALPGHLTTVFGEGARQLAPLIEHVRDGCIFIDYEYRVGFLNLAARRDMASRGADPDRVPGSAIWDVLQYPEGTPARSAVEGAVRDRVPTYFTTRGTHGPYWVEVDVVPLDQGCLLYYRDATSMSSAEEARAASERAAEFSNERLRVVIDDAPLAVLVVDNDGVVEHWNPATETMFQWTAAEVVGHRLPHIPEDERETFDANLVRARQGESFKAMPARRIRKDGVMLDVQVSSSPLRDRAGAVTGSIVMISDVTAHRKLEEQLRMAQKMEAVGLLAGGVAHDFNNLLTAIKGFTSLLEMSIGRDDQSGEFLAEISKAADRAAALTAQLLAFSRKQLLRPESLDLNVRIRELERMLRLLLREYGQLELALDPSLGHVLADPGQVEQVLLNLVVNARDAIHGREGSSVTIRTSNVELHHEFDDWGVEPRPGAYVRLDVIDNGCGMDRATLARIFDPFFTTKEPGHGTGLGLATVFGIVKQSDGYVWVDSRPSQGATFSVYLPRTHVAMRTSGAHAVTARGGTECILVVEDEDAVRRVARRALELQGYSVLDAPDGESALEMARGHHIDLVVSDVMMPGMLGPAFAAKLRATHPNLPVMFMSGHSDDIVRQGLLDPDTPFLAKPFTPAQLAGKVREELDRSAALRRPS
ncbi:MAG: PAS domain S-box protein [Gemmatimonadaceae bacterium]